LGKIDVYGERYCIGKEETVGNNGNGRAKPGKWGSGPRKPGVIFPLDITICMVTKQEFQLYIPIPRD
jgi:hypothetical protein